MRAIALLVLLVPGAALAQSVEDDRFFIDKTDEDEEATLWQGSITSTSFLHREVAGVSDAAAGGVVGVENAGPTRWFSDLRAQLDARHIAGKTWDARADVRVRYVNDLENQGGGQGDPDPQSGAFSGNEYEIRDLYVVRGTTRTDLIVGRQTVLDVAGVKIDGMRLDYAKNERWTYLGFAGLYPQRGSRSITTDYPYRVGADGQESGKRVTPAAAGLGGAYRTTRTYGAVGVAGIAPLANDKDTGTLEQPRLFLTTNGYWRQSGQMDLFHYVVFDVIGSGGLALTNGSLAVNYRPQPRLHVNGAIHHVDTETLHVQAQTALEDPDDRDVGVIQNNVTVARISSDSARLSVSAALGRTLRWEVTVAGAARQRPEVVLEADENGTDQTIPAARSGEIFFQAVDRRFYGGVRLSGSFIRIFGIGTNAARSSSQIVRVGASREFADGRGEWEADVRYLSSADENRMACTTTNIVTCYGAAEVTAYALGGTAFYRLTADWFAMGTFELARQRLTTLDGMTAVENPAILGTTGFFRLAYRF